MFSISLSALQTTLQWGNYRAQCLHRLPQSNLNNLSFVSGNEDIQSGKYSDLLTQLKNTEHTAESHN